MKLKKVKGSLSCLTIGGADVYFSYETPIALITPLLKIVSENIWSKTTAGQINEVKRRYSCLELPNKEFVEELDKYFN